MITRCSEDAKIPLITVSLQFSMNCHQISTPPKRYLRCLRSKWPQSECATVSHAYAASSICLSAHGQKIIREEIIKMSINDPGDILIET